MTTKQADTDFLGWRLMAEPTDETTLRTQGEEIKKLTRQVRDLVLILRDCRKRLDVLEGYEPL